MKLSTFILSPAGAALILLDALLLVSAASSPNPLTQKGHGQSRFQKEQVKVESGLHKMIGVDYRPGDSPNFDYEQALRSDIEDHVSSSPVLKKDTHLKYDSQQMTNSDVSTPNSCLLFADEFDTLDNSVWRHDLTLTGGGNYEVQAYINNRTNTFVKDGVFYIRPTLTENRIGVQALHENGVLDMWGTDPGTQCTGNYDYGCYRVAGAGGNILNPIQSGLAIWMLPSDYNYGGWPASGEIDIVESRGNGPEYPAGGVDKVASTLHWGPSYEFNRFEMTHKEYALRSGKTFADDFHTFTLDWKPEGLKTYVDNNLVLDVPFNDMFKKGKFPSWIDNLWSNSNAAPFDQNFYLIMNVAVAGTAGYFPDGVGDKPWSDKSPHAVNEFYAAKDDWYPTWGPESGTTRALAVDYIRVYKYNCN
ncbi:hypothetical protein BGZ46_005687 [Entomortierella lignicola]|nr:hypothetical protein BGZ46_005687 [Entomortierella lignicola]